MSSNADQVDFWNGPSGDRWVRHQDALDRALEPIGRPALVAANAQPGELVVDVGCGCGATTLALAAAVGANGAVLGLDVSAPMLQEARSRARALANTAFTLDDAAICRFSLPQRNLVFSRFGVMFFRDPAAAFANLRGALRPDGRLVFVCWGPVVDNPWFRVPMMAAGTVVPLPDPTGPEEPGPFAFADRARVQRILETAGFTEITFERSVVDFVFGSDLETATTFAVEAGSVARLLLDADDTTRTRIRAAVRDALAPHLGAKGVVLPASTWIVRARNA